LSSYQKSFTKMRACRDKIVNSLFDYRYSYTIKTCIKGNRYLSRGGVEGIISTRPSYETVLKIYGQFQFKRTPSRGYVREKISLLLISPCSPSGVLRKSMNSVGRLSCSVIPSANRPALQTWYFAVLRIRDVFSDPGSDFFPSRIRIFSIPDPGSASNNFSILTQNNGF
jgi:hypothetical protein